MRNTVPEEAGQVLNLSGINSHRQTIFARDLDLLSITVRIKDGHYVRKLEFFVYFSSNRPNAPCVLSCGKTRNPSVEISSCVSVNGSRTLSGDCGSHFGACLSI